MIVSLNDIVKAKAKELGINEKAARLAMRSVDKLIDEIIADSGFDVSETYTEEEFNERFSNLRFVLPHLGQIRFNYRLYKRANYYAKSRENNTSI
ncbi:MAG: hypothetical protein J6N78_05225 [Clostridia bacterium]|nr:hypothetical protein [Clostridia bacterium]